MPAAAAAPTAHNDDQHPCEGSGSGDRAAVDDRRRSSILPTPHQKSSQNLHPYDNVHFSHYYDAVHKSYHASPDSKLS